MPVELETSRLRMRAWSDHDLAPFAELNADPDVMMHFPARLSRAESDALAALLRAAYGRDGLAWWVVEDGARSFCGIVGLAKPSFDVPFAHATPCVEVGWRLAKRAWGKGFATEAATAALSYGFDTLGLVEIVSFTTPDNLRSRRVMEKLGMSHHPADDFDHPRVPEGHRLRRHVLYRARAKRH